MKIPELIVYFCNRYQFQVASFCIIIFRVSCSDLENAIQVTLVDEADLLVSDPLEPGKNDENCLLSAPFKPVCAYQIVAYFHVDLLVFCVPD